MLSRSASLVSRMSPRSGFTGIRSFAIQVDGMNSPKNSPMTKSKMILTYIATEGPKTRKELRAHLGLESEGGVLKHNRELNKILTHLRCHRRLHPNRKFPDKRTSIYHYSIHRNNPYVVDNPYVAEDGTDGMSPKLKDKKK